MINLINNFFGSWFIPTGMPTEAPTPLGGIEAPTHTSDPTIQFPFIASNRAFSLPKVEGDYQSVTEDGDLSYHSFSGKTLKNPEGYDAWMSNIVNSPLSRSGSRVMIFIHGYYNKWEHVTKTWDDATNPNTYGLSGMVTNFHTLQSSHYPNTGPINASYPGPVVLFDWPSYFEIKLPLCGSYRKAQENAKLTADRSMPYLRRIIDDLRKNNKEVDVVSHSMGNLVFQQGARLLTPGSVSTVLNVAAAIPDYTYVRKFGVIFEGWGMLQSLGDNRYADVLWSTHDTALPEAIVCDSSRTELGLSGPAPGSINATSHDCSQWVKSEESPNGGQKNVHISYYFLQTTLDLMISLLTKTSPTPTPTHPPTPPVTTPYAS